MNTLPDNLQSKLKRELDEGEVVQWSAQPSERLVLRSAKRSARFFILFMWILIVGLLIPFWLETLGVIDSGSDPEFSIWGFVVVTVILILLSIWVYIGLISNQRHFARNTIYAITNQRVIILLLKKNGEIVERDYTGDELVHLARYEKPDGAGDLVFESARGASTHGHKFRSIEQVIEVERMLRAQFGKK